MATHYFENKLPIKTPKGKNELEIKRISSGTYEITNTEPKVVLQRVSKDYDTLWVLMFGGITRTETERRFHLNWLTDVRRGHIVPEIPIKFIN